MTEVLCVVPNGTIPAGFYNVLSCCYCSVVVDWWNIYDKLRRFYLDTGLKFVVGSAFRSSKNAFLISLWMMTWLLIKNLKLTRSKWQIWLKREATSMRQAAEWGMRDLQSSYPRLKDTLLYEEFGECHHIFHCLLHLFDLCSRHVGINQITNVYLPALCNNANGQLYNTN